MAADRKTESMIKARRPLQKYGIFILLSFLFLCAAVTALWLGSSKLSLSEVFAGLFSEENTKISVIIRHIRLPRMLAALLAGVGLSVSGVLLQGVTDNGLASPNIIGVNSGAGFLTILMLSCFPHAVFALPFAAFFGAFLTTLLIVWTANRIGSSKTTIILAGMALTTILNAGISFISLLDTDVVAVYNYFSVGGLSGVTMERLLIPAVLIFLSLGVSLLLSPKISLLCLGDSLASSLGVRVRFLRIVCLLCASASAAAVVSFAGLLGFVGLIVPHIARRLTGGGMTKALLSSSLVGGTIVMLADTIGRTLFAPTEIPVGIVMALVGAPFFLVLLLRRREHA